MLPRLFIVIATSNGRTKLLFKRALKSVLTQNDSYPAEIIIVDDNPVVRNISVEFHNIIKEIRNISDKLIFNKNYWVYARIRNSESNIWYLINKRVRGRSGTGAWNTALEFIHNRWKNELQRSFIAFLDDDDEYVFDYTKELKRSFQRKKDLIAIFPFLEWIMETNNLIHRFHINDLNPESFFVGNPGIQTSNMCIRADVLLNLGGFDENLYSATDRDLMLRFARTVTYLDPGELSKKIEIISDPMVLYHAEEEHRVTNNYKFKKMGLDYFLYKHKKKFSDKQYEESLNRAKVLFGYEQEKSNTNWYSLP